MTATASHWLKIGLALVPLCGGAWAGLNARFVQKTTYDVHMVLDSLDRTQTHAELHEVITRLQQIQCGSRVAQGCR